MAGCDSDEPLDRIFAKLEGISEKQGEHSVMLGRLDERSLQQEVRFTEQVESVRRETHQASRKTGGSWGTGAGALAGALAAALMKALGLGTPGQ